jgi:uncharacterized membrane protein
MNDPLRLRRLHHLVIGSLVLLIAFTLLPAFLEDSRRWTTDLLLNLPLVAFVFTLGVQYPRRYSWLCFVVLAYFCGAVLDAFQWPAPRGITGMVAVTLCCITFIASMVASRWSERLANQPVEPHA